MSREHIDHKDIQHFADRVVNLKRDDAGEHRAQVNRLGDKLKEYVDENPDFQLRKILLSGSLAKHTALKNISDADVAVYVRSAPEDVGELTEWLATKLRTAFPNFKHDQVVVQNYSVKVEFRKSGLDVDVVPVYQEDKGNDWGHLVSQEDGTKLKTNISLHREFIAKWRKKHTPYYAQAVRLLKWWAKSRKEANDQFKFKSFMVELVLATVFRDEWSSDNEDYPEIMLGFFDYIAKTDFGEVVYFTDYAEEPSPCGDPIRVFDPVNPENNVARKYNQYARDVIVREAIDAGDAIDAALNAPTKELTVYYWQKVFGSSFSA